MPNPLEGVRVLDLASPIGAYCGRILCDLGARVTRVEPPGGDPIRKESPTFRLGEQDVSAAYLFMHSGKRSVTLNVLNPDSRQLISQMLSDADIVIHSYTEDQSAELLFDYPSLARINPSLIVTVITPFGLGGPKGNQQANDIVALAAGGLLSLSGEPGRPPLQIAGHQAYIAAGLFGAVGTLLALLGRERTLSGTLVDVSMQEAVAGALENAVPFFDLEQLIRKRAGATGYSQDRAGAGLFPCKDGWIYLLAGGIGGDAGWRRLAGWLTEEGIAEEARLLEDPWTDAEWRRSPEAKSEFNAWFCTLAKGYTMSQLEKAAQQRNMPLAAVRSMEDISADDELTSAENVAVADDERILRVPGLPFEFDPGLDVRDWTLPMIGRDNANVYGALGITSDGLTILTEAGVI